MTQFCIAAKMLLKFIPQQQSIALFEPIYLSLGSPTYLYPGSIQSQNGKLHRIKETSFAKLIGRGSGRSAVCQIKLHYSPFTVI
jgi:hypothetical protein